MSATVKPQKKSGKRLSQRTLKEWLFAYGMLLIPLIQFAIFYIWINSNSIIMAFQEFSDYNEAGGEIYIWSLYNFKRFFNEFRNPESEVLYALKNTFKYFGTAVLMIPTTFLVSYFLYKKVWGYKLFRVVFFLPSIISAVLFVTTYKRLIALGGPLDQYIFKLFGTRVPSLLSDERATGTIIAYTVWTGFGVNMLLYQSAMSRVPVENIEAAALDGCPWYRELWSIIIPMVWPTISTTLILCITAMFNSTGPILLFAEAGQQIDRPATTTISFWIYRKTQNGIDLNYPAAIGLFFTFVSIPVVFFVRWLFNRIDPDVTY